jgi:catechol 2,3-dioxygenase-like lactoylglutathione lyase family enzyme
MIHHLSLGTNDVARARRFYEAAFPVAGLHLMQDKETELIYEAGTFLVSPIMPINGHPAMAGNRTHVAFAAEDRGMVHRFHAAALANGGTDDGAPGLRPEYDANDYGAFVRDRDGNKIEAVTYSAKGAGKPRRPWC